MYLSLLLHRDIFFFFLLISKKNGLDEKEEAQSDDVDRDELWEKTFLGS